jgi:hypothetical protein
MKSDRRRKTSAAPTEQLAAENDWLAGRHLPESFREMLSKPSPTEQEVNEHVWAILRDARLAPLLHIIEQHNRRPREVPERRLPRKDHFLLGPYVRLVLTSVQQRNEVRRELPVLDQPPAQVRVHLQKVAADCEALAKLVRQGPQPHVALAAETSLNEWLAVFNPLTQLFEASDGSERQTVAFTGLLERAASWFDALAGHVPRARQNRRTGNGALRVRAAEFLPGVFRGRLGHPYHAHVATVATIVSGIDTDADFVKKAEAQQTSAGRRPETGRD